MTPEPPPAGFLFPLDPPGAPPASFVFELGPRELFEKATCIIPELLVEGAVGRAGFRGTDQEFAACVDEFSGRLVRHFTDDREFAARVAAAVDPRPEMIALVGHWARQRRAGRMAEPRA